jgi:hypothetical protein
MFNRQTTIEFMEAICDELGASKIVAVHGSAMVLLGIKFNTNDVDCFGDFAKLAEYPKSGITTAYGDVVFYKDQDLVAIPLEDSRYQNLMHVSGRIYCTPPEVIINDKLALGRPKDLEQIKMVEQYMLCMR